jgi:hypothetical protein
LIQILLKEIGEMDRTAYSIFACFLALTILTACGAPAGNTNLTASNTNLTNSNVNANLNVANANFTGTSSTVDAREPDEYQAKVQLNFEAIGDQQKATLPTISAIVSRRNADRRMEFTLANGEKVIYLDTAGNNYLILPNRRQYAELNRDTLGFEVRRMMLPEQIVNQVKGMQGVERVGEETMNGRRVVKYRYAAVANTQTQAGQVGTESYLLVDTETGLPLRSETMSQSQTGGNVQGYKGLRIVTEMTDINLDPDPAQFTLPADYAKIDAEQVKAQANLIFSAVATLVGQAIQQGQQQSLPSVSPTTTPVR